MPPCSRFPSRSSSNPLPQVIHHECARYCSSEHRLEAGATQDSIVIALRIHRADFGWHRLPAGVKLGAYAVILLPQSPKSFHHVNDIALSNAALFTFSFEIVK